jgi:hypothetical protein
MELSEDSKDEFAQLVIARLQEAGVTDEISYDPQEFQVAVAGDKKSILFLHNAYQEYCTTSEEDRPLALCVSILAMSARHGRA